MSEPAVGPLDGLEIKDLIDEIERRCPASIVAWKVPFQDISKIGDSALRLSGDPAELAWLYLIIQHNMVSLADRTPPTDVTDHP
jgi:hypothetical protein